jgi:hypothetical protein
VLKEEYRLRVFENMSLIRIFEPRREELIGELRKAHSKELHNLYASPNNIRLIKSERTRWTGNVALMIEKIIAYVISVGKLKGKKPLGRRRR